MLHVTRNTLLVTYDAAHVVGINNSQNFRSLAPIHIHTSDVTEVTPV